MKKIIIIILLILPTIGLFAVDWSQYGYLPCTTSGPAWENLTEGNYSYTDPNHPCYGCTFKVVYATRWNNNHYEMIVLGVFLVNGSNCNSPECSSWNVIWGFYSNLLEDNANYQPGFIDQIHNGGGLGDTLETYVYSTARCFNTNQMECDSITIRCCKKTYKITYGISNGLYYINQVSEGNSIIPPCPPPCTPLCEQNRPLEDGFLACKNLPCQFGVWQHGYKNVNLAPYGCPACTVTVFYKYRTTINCEPNYNDYYIYGSQFDANCSGCVGFTEQQMFQILVQAVLKYGEHPKPPMGNCDTVTRVAHASCWNYHGDYGDTTGFYPCPDTGCCWSRYLACTDYSTPPKTTYSKIDGNNDTITCRTVTRPCINVCATDPEPKLPILLIDDDKLIENRDYSIIKPNPSNGLIDICFKFKQTGKLKIEIYNLNGIILRDYEESYLGGNKSITLDILNFTNGVYYYNIYIGNNFITSKIFTLIK